jgi:acetyltransferase-like isoleucine patch superfamily enzyme
MASPTSLEPAPTAFPENPGAPPRPLRGNAVTLLRFLAAHGMLRRQYVSMFVRLAWHKLRLGRRLQLDGLAFIRPGVRLEVGRSARLHLGRWSWIGDDTKLRIHEGELSIGAKTVLGQECTISCFQHIEIGRECIIADRTMMIDFDHVTDDVERSIRRQGIRKRDIHVGHNVWIGYGVSVLSGVTIGDNSVIGAAAVVTADAPANAILAGVPARVVRKRETPDLLRFD